MFFHGCKNEEKAQKIIDSGELIGFPIKSKGHLAPMADRVYLSRNSHYAGMYALGGDFFNSKSFPDIIDKDGQYGYIFVIDPDTLDASNILPDEDSIGKCINEAKYVLKEGAERIDWLKKHNFNSALSEKLIDNLSLCRTVMSLGRYYMTDTQFERCLEGHYAYFASGGKRLLKNASPGEIAIFTGLSEEISVLGPVAFQQAWKMDKKLCSNIPHCPTWEDILSVSEEIEHPNLEYSGFKM